MRRTLLLDSVLLIDFLVILSNKLHSVYFRFKVIPPLSIRIRDRVRFRKFLNHEPFSPAPNDQTVLPSLETAMVCELPQTTCPTPDISFTSVGTLRLLLSPWPGQQENLNFRSDLKHSSTKMKDPWTFFSLSKLSYTPSPHVYNFWILEIGNCSFGIRNCSILRRITVVELH